MKPGYLNLWAALAAVNVGLAVLNGMTGEVGLTGFNAGLALFAMLMFAINCLDQLHQALTKASASQSSETD